MQHHTLETIYTLLSASTTPKQNIRVEIKKLLPLIAQLDPINYLDYYQEIMLLIQQIEQETQQKQIAEKTIIGVGGGFSAGKSRFINSLLAIEALPEALEPCTAVATYLSASQQEQTHALNLLNHHISLKSEQLGQLRHFVGDNSTQNDIQLGELIQYVHLGIPELKWEHIAFLDTPGYSKADAEHHHHSDEKLAINQLSKADYLIWLVNAKNGTIRDEDLQFLQKITPKEPIFVVLTQSDLVNRSDIEPILKSVRKNLKSRNIKIAGLMAWAAPIMKLEGERLAGDDIQQWLNEINQPVQQHANEKLDTLIQNILSIGSNQTKQLQIEIETLNTIKNKQKDATKTNILIQSKELNKKNQIESNCALALQMAKIYEHLFENLLGASKFHVMIIDYLLRFLDSSNDDGNIKYFLKEHTLGSSSLNWLYTKSLSDVTSVKTEFERLVNRTENKELQYKYALLLEKQQNIKFAIEYMFLSAQQGYEPAYNWLKDYSKKENLSAQLKMTELFELGKVKNSDSEIIFDYCYNAIRYKSKKSFFKFVENQAEEKKYPLAQFLLGVCYYFGYGIESNKSKSYYLFKTSSSHHKKSFLNMIIMDYLGNQKEKRKEALIIINNKSQFDYDFKKINKILSNLISYKKPLPFDFHQDDLRFSFNCRKFSLHFISVILCVIIFFSIKTFHTYYQNYKKYQDQEKLRIIEEERIIEEKRILSLAKEKELNMEKLEKKFNEDYRKFSYNKENLFKLENHSNNSHSYFEKYIPISKEPILIKYVLTNPDQDRLYDDTTPMYIQLHQKIVSPIDGSEYDIFNTEDRIFKKINSYNLNFSNLDQNCEYHGEAFVNVNYLSIEGYYDSEYFSSINISKIHSIGKPKIVCNNF